ncbi:PepSY-associated TM helix domain-containing protein [Deefgea rivuli]|uniref:PepSY-associated TM helix domain-containing protein n=1 Tax=Deefgea rivuli TaxID=400948 RepID=UPI000485B20A|nr:PepSY-associated TM helix domain-containing protein [Deefgea rivuli]
MARLFNRQTLVLLHRWMGLTITLFLFCAGLTGALLAFNEELDVWLASDLYQIDIPHAAKPLPALVLHQRVNAQLAPRAELSFLQLAIPREHALATWVNAKTNPATKQPFELGFDQVFIDPYTGQIQGAREWNEFGFSLNTLMPFLYRFHYTFAIPEWGVLTMGIVALIWMFDCFVGAYLTFPKGRPFVEKWRPAWKIKTAASFHRINLDLHRASGLWLWAVLLIFAWSSVAFNLREQVYYPVMKSFTTFQQDVWSLPPQALSKGEVKLNWPQALAHAEQAMQHLAQERGFTVGQAERMFYLPEQNMYAYRVKTSLDVGELAMSDIAINAASGERVGYSLPSSIAAGDTITSWLYALHMAKVWGMPYRIFVCILGLMVAALTATGLILWWKKRQARQGKKTPKLVKR